MTASLALSPHIGQVLLHRLLQAELLHTFGAYGLASAELAELSQQYRALDEFGWRPALDQSVKAAISLNDALRRDVHRPADLRSDPSRLPGARDGVPPRHPYPGDEELSSAVARYIVAFYSTVATTLAAYGSNPDGSSPECELGRALATVHDPHRQADVTTGALLEGRISRNEERRRQAAGVLGVPHSAPRVSSILYTRLDIDDPEPLHNQVLVAFTQGHRCMHRAEHYLSHSFGDRLREFSTIEGSARTELRQSVVLNTFVYVAARSAPWAFAEDRVEHRSVLDTWPICCQSLTPLYCMWIPRQLSLLALHRRAYSFWLLGEFDKAYRDFHKLVRFLRAMRPDVQQRAVRAPGAMRFIDGLTAVAEHHIGRIYASQHAHKVARKYFDRAQARLDPWEDVPEVAEALVNSRWRVQLLISHAKASYELGRIKECLLSYVRAWRAFLDLVSSESRATANFDVVDSIIAWLIDVRADPDVDKAELRDRVAPLVQQFRTVVGPSHLRILAAEIIMRLGHVLLILRLPDPTGDAVDNALASSCMLHAAKLDRSSTFLAADLLKVAQRSPELKKRMREAADDMLPIEQQWSSGGGRFEEAALAIEYVLQHWLDKTHAEEDDTRAQIARGLLAGFLLHTDSSNVKLAQVYRYLMQKRQARELRSPENPALDLVSMRRYSSFFPFLPRPSASRAPGGGYFVHVHEPGHDPFGVAIDPGPDFAENLYRCGYGLSDIDMIVVTHDHADHLASLDALLALMGYRLNLHDRTFNADARLVIVGNDSVYERYEFYNDWSNRKDYVCVTTFEDFDDASRVHGDDRGAVFSGLRHQAGTLRIQPVQTYDHYDSAGHIAQGFLLSVGDTGEGPSIFFTSDSGPMTRGGDPAERRCSRGTTTMAEAVAQADVVVAHLSSVPLKEVRGLAGFAEPPPEADSLTQQLTGLWDAERVDDPESFLLDQLRFAFRSFPSKGAQSDITPLSPIDQIDAREERHLFVSGVIEIAERLHADGRQRLLLIGELREELGTFRTRVAAELNRRVFAESSVSCALTTDVGLKVHVEPSNVRVLCSTCDLDNDLVPAERFHPVRDISEICVKGEDEGIFYNCGTHNPARREARWVEAVERYDLFAR